MDSSAYGVSQRTKPNQWCAYSFSLPFTAPPTPPPEPGAKLDCTVSVSCSPRAVAPAVAPPVLVMATADEPATPVLAGVALREATAEEVAPALATAAVSGSRPSRTKPLISGADVKASSRGSFAATCSKVVDGVGCLSLSSPRQGQWGRPPPYVCVGLVRYLFSARFVRAHTSPPHWERTCTDATARACAGRATACSEDYRPPPSHPASTPYSERGSPRPPRSPLAPTAAPPPVARPCRHRTPPSRPPARAPPALNGPTLQTCGTPAALGGASAPPPPHALPAPEAPLLRREGFVACVSAGN